MNLVSWALKWGISVEALEDLKHDIGIGPMPQSNQSESSISKMLRFEYAKQGVVLWRNNVGATYDEHGNFIRYGLANDTRKMNETIKSSDLIGIKPNGQFICREVKAGDWQYSGTEHEQAQLKFINLVLSKGGDAGFANSVDEAVSKK